MTTGHLLRDDRSVHAGDRWGEIVVTGRQRIRRRCAASLAAITAAATWAGGAPAALAAPVPPPGTGDAGGNVPLAPARTAALAGIHGWQVILIAIGAVLAGALLAVVYDRARATRQGHVSADITRA
jgi:hypothetical protein